MMEPSSAVLIKFCKLQELHVKFASSVILMNETVGEPEGESVVRTLSFPIITFFISRRPPLASIRLFSGVSVLDSVIVILLSCT